jgi:hypothetical protein
MRYSGSPIGVKETSAIKGLFPQEKATLHDFGDFTRNGEPL